MIEGITVRFLNNDFRFHAGQIGQLLDELPIVAREDTGEARLHCGGGAGGDDGAVSVRELEHFRDTLAGGDFQIRDADKMAARHRHDSFDFGAHQRATQHRHGSLPVDDRGYAQFFVNISGGAEAGEGSGLVARSARRGEHFASAEERPHERAESA